MSEGSHTHRSERVAADLAGYGDLADFERQLSAPSVEADDQAAIDLVMGGNAFLAGDGTLEVGWKNSRREPAVQSDASRAHRATNRATRAAYGAEHGTRDSTAPVARVAVAEALARLEVLAGVPSQSVAQDPSVQSGGALAGANLHSSVHAYERGSDVQSESSSPFTVPGGALYLMPSKESVLEVSAIHNTGSAHSLAPPPASASSRDTECTAVVGVHEALIDPFTGVPDEAVRPAKPEERPPLETLGERRSLDPNAFDSARAEIPAYARASNRSLQAISAADLVLDDLLPPASAHSRAAARTDLTEGQPHDEASHASTASGTGEDELDGVAPTADAELRAEQAADETPEGTAVVGRRTMPLARYRSVLIALVLGVVLVSVKYFAAAPRAVTQEQSMSASAGVPIEGASESVRQNELTAALGLAMPSTSNHTSSPGVQRGIARFDDIPSKETPSTSESVLKAQLAELTERASALASERDALRAENAAMKREDGRPKAQKSPAAKRAAARVALTAVHPEPELRIAPNIQYLGTFTELGQPVAEILLDGSLVRVKRGDVLKQDLRVDDVGEMSVTIRGTTYTP